MMKSMLIEKSALFIGTIYSLFLVSTTNLYNKQDTVENTVIVPTTSSVVNKVDNPPVVTAAIIDSILHEAKVTSDAYNKSINDVKKVNKELLDLTKKEVQNSKTTSSLVKRLTNQFKHNFTIKRHHTVNAVVSETSFIKDNTELKIDSICTSYRKPFLAKERCVDWGITYYIIKDNKKIILKNPNN